MFHKEGFNLIILFFVVVTIDVLVLEVLLNDSSSLKSFLQILSLILFVFILWFFRNPKRNITLNPDSILSPADGKIIIIEEVTETEFFNDKRKKVSIFLSLIDINDRIIETAIKLM